MSIVFNGSTSSCMSSAFGASRPSAYSVCAWIKADAVYGSTLREVMRVGDSAAYPNEKGDLVLAWGHPDAGYRGRAYLHTTGISYAATNTGGTNSAVWMHYCATYAATRLRFYENGVQIGSTSNQTVTAGSPSDWLVTIGGASGIFSGKIMMAAYYDIELSADDCAGLGKGIAPLHVRPQSLRYYVPGIRTAKAVIGNTSTDSNLTYSDDNPRIYL